MKVLQFWALIMFICGCFVLANAQADCFLDFRLNVQDSNGNIVKNTSVKLNLNDVEYNSNENVYQLRKRISCYEKNGLLKVKVEGFSEFVKQIEKMVGHQSYNLILNTKGLNSPPVFEKFVVFRGQVVDENNALIVGAKIEIKEKSDKTYFGKTDEYGRFDFDLPIGKYKAKISQIGFKDLKLINFNIDNTESINLDLKLKVRSCEDCRKSILGKDFEKQIQEVVLEYQKIKEQKIINR